MLKRTTIDSVSPLVTNLINNGVAVEAIPNTPLGNLVAAMHHPIMDTRAWEDSPADVREKLNVLMQQVEATDEDGSGDHQAQLDAQIKVTADSLRNSILFTRTVVKPQIDMVLEQVNLAIKETNTAIANSMAVTPDVYEPIWESSALASLAEPFLDVPKLGTIGDPRVHPQRTPEEVVQMLSTGSGRLDKELQEWVKTIGVDTVYGIYNGFFAARPVSLNGEAYSADFNAGSWLDGTGKTYRTNALVIFALAHHLINNILEDIDMSLNAYEQMMTAVIAQSGLTINNVIEWRENCKKSKSLIIAWPVPGAEYRTFWAEGSQILVNNDVYLEWLEKGGCPEILMGAAISDRVSDGDFLLENGEKYLEQWRRRAALVRTAQYNERRVTIINTLRDALTNIINSMKDEDQILGDRAPYHQKLEHALSHCKHEDPDRVYQIVRRVVCATLYDYRDCLQILETIDAMAEREPDLPIDEVATLAIADIVVAWLVKQVTVRG